MSDATRSPISVNWSVVTEKHTYAALQASHVDLTSKLSCKEVIDRIYKDNIVSPDDMEEIKAHPVQRDARNSLLGVVRMRGVRGFRCFTQALYDTAQDELYATLMEELRKLVPPAFCTDSVTYTEHESPNLAAATQSSTPALVASVQPTARVAPMAIVNPSVTDEDDSEDLR